MSAASYPLRRRILHRALVAAKRLVANPTDELIAALNRDRLPPEGAHVAAVRHLALAIRTLSVLSFGAQDGVQERIRDVDTVNSGIVDLQARRLLAVVLGWQDQLSSQRVAAALGAPTPLPPIASTPLHPIQALARMCAESQATPAPPILNPFTFRQSPDPRRQRLRVEYHGTHATIVLPHDKPAFLGLDDDHTLNLITGVDGAVVDYIAIDFLALGLAARITNLE